MPGLSDKKLLMALRGGTMMGEGCERTLKACNAVGSLTMQSSETHSIPAVGRSILKTGAIINI